MAKGGGDMTLTGFIVMILIALFLGDCVLNPYEETKAHKFLEQQGISQRIENFEYKLKN